MSGGVTETTFVGRHAETEQVIRLVRRARLVTLTGPGGVGKTRLAHRVAEVIGVETPGGFRIVDLSSLTDPHELPRTVAAVLGFAPGDGSVPPTPEALAARLDPRGSLLVLDTCEHLAEPVARLTVALLGAAPRLRVLTTSRRPLGPPGEHVYPVPPMRTEDAVALLRDRAAIDPAPFPAPGLDPDPGSSPGPGQRPDLGPGLGQRSVPGQGSVPGPDSGQRSDLGSDLGPVPGQGTGSTPDPYPDPDPDELVALCERLDRIPLAVELAAVRLRAASPALSPALLARSLDDRYAVLTGGGGPVRHQSMRAAMGRSHELCSPAERLLWARLSVFPAGFDLEAAERVCAGEPLPAGEVLDALTGLADQSLVRREEHPAGTRLRMLDTVREFGAEWLLRLGETDDLRSRHRDHYLRLAGRCAAEWPERQAEWAGRMRAERHNLHAALDLCLADPARSRSGAALAGSLWFLWICCGLPDEGRHCLDAALRMHAEPGPERFRVLWARSWVALRQGDPQTAGRLLDLLRAEDREGRATGHALQIEGLIALVRREFVRAARLLGRAADGHATGGAEDPGDPRRGSGAGSPGGAEDSADRGGREDRRGGMSPEPPACHALAALSLLAAGRAGEAAETLARDRRPRDDPGGEWSRVQTEYALAWIERIGNRGRTAARHARTALAGAWRLGDPLLTVACLELVAWTATTPTPPGAAGNAEAEAAGGRVAAGLLGAARAARDSRGARADGWPVDAMIRRRAAAEAVRVLGGAGFDTRFTEGMAFDLAFAVDYALGEKNP
ncbi:ATP-binding protein [Streptosporangium sandarakinum]|uniref:ATP-binding protein n=1 Tax=Streptosporangium sandarakinum TaxID=1260955 RepID=UPI0033A2AB7C